MNRTQSADPLVSEQGNLLGLLERIFAVAFLAGVFFPFIKVVPGIGSDTQPTALLFGIALLSSGRRIDFPAPLALLFVVALVSLPLLLLDGLSLVGVRNWSNYVSAFVFAAVGWQLARLDRNLVSKSVVIAAWVWFVFGAIQTFVFREFGVFLLADGRTSESRGVVGLAPEPSMYGQMCLLIVIAAQILLEGRRRTVVVAIAVIQLVLFSRSAIAVLLLLIWVGGMVARGLAGGRGLRIAIPLVLFAAVSLHLLVEGKIPGLAESRLQALASLALQNPMLLLTADESGAVRAASIVYAFAGLVDGYGIPRGFVAWDTFGQAVAHRFAMIPAIPGGYRPMSGYGSAVFELGFISVLVFIAVAGAFARWGGRSWLQQWPTILTFHMLLLSSVPLATPLVGLILGAASARRPDFRIVGGEAK